MTKFGASRIRSQMSARRANPNRAGRVEILPPVNTRTDALVLSIGRLCFDVVFKCQISTPVFQIS